MCGYVWLCVRVCVRYVSVRRYVFVCVFVCVGL